MYAGDEWSAERYFQMRLADLCYIDEREGALEYETESLRVRKLSLAAGVGGALAHRVYRLGGDSRIYGLINEVTSVYAEVAHRLGYLQVDRRLCETEWHALKNGVRHHRHLCQGGDIRAADIVALYGVPSLSIGGSWSRTLCYAADHVAEPWIYFDTAVVADVFRESFTGDPVSDVAAWHQHLGIGNPPLRTIRWPTSKSFRMTFTPYGGRVLRSTIEVRH